MHRGRVNVAVPRAADRAGRGMVEDGAKIEKMLLRGGSFFQRHLTPFCDEFLNRHVSDNGCILLVLAVAVKKNASVSGRLHPPRIWRAADRSMRSVAGQSTQASVTETP